jgi:hypothetical protein
MEPMLVVLLGLDGGNQHAVAIVEDLLFDSSLPNALKLTKCALDWSCSCEGGYVRVKMAIKFQY